MLKHLKTLNTSRRSRVQTTHKIFQTAHETKRVTFGVPHLFKKGGIFIGRVKFYMNNERCRYTIAIKLEVADGPIRNYVVV